MKRFLNTLFLVAVAAVLTPSLFAQPPGPPGGQRGGGQEGGQGDPGQAVLQALDVDGNREISAAEIANAPAALITLDANGDGKLSDADQGGGQQGRGNQANQQQGQGRGGPGGPGGPGGQGGAPNAQQFVTDAMSFDSDNDGKLDATELSAFAEQMGPPNHQGGPPPR